MITLNRPIPFHYEKNKNPHTIKAMLLSSFMYFGSVAWPYSSNTKTNHGQKNKNVFSWNKYLTIIIKLDICNNKPDANFHSLTYPGVFSGAQLNKMRSFQPPLLFFSDKKFGCFVSAWSVLTCHEQRCAMQRLSLAFVGLPVPISFLWFALYDQISSVNISALTLKVLT